MDLSLAEIQAVSEIADLLYGFLPGKPHPCADPAISFRGVAQTVGVSAFWADGSKKPSIAKLLEMTLSQRRDLFCSLIIRIVRKAILYRSKQGKPLTREEIENLNQLLLKVQFKIPELWDPDFLRSLPSNQPPAAYQAEESKIPASAIGELKDQLMKLTEMAPQPRGFAFEKFLNKLFSVYGLSPRPPFRLVGEQIDGSFQLGQNTYLLEAKWQDAPIGQADLLVFSGKVGGKSTWSRGVFISYSGFSEEGIQAFRRGPPLNIIGMNSQDLFFILDGSITLQDAIEKKARIAAEEGEYFISVFDLVRQIVGG